MRAELPRLGCVIMAAGSARRFGDNKLAGSSLGGKPLHAPGSGGSAGQMPSSRWLL